MNIAGKFEKVSPSRFRLDWADTFAEESAEQIAKIYEEIRMPVRATVGSAGYDFYSPFDFVLSPGQTIKIPTGIRARIEDGWVLMIFPRSGLGFRYGIRLTNTVGVIDADYCNSDNGGHIIISLENPSASNVQLPEGKAFCQGIVVNYEIPDGAESEAERSGGFGSTDSR